MTVAELGRSRALWNRARLGLASDEQLAQLLDRGEMWAWRELFRLAASDPALRGRIRDVVMTVPVALPHFWLAALVALGEELDLSAPLPRADYEARV